MKTLSVEAQSWAVQFRSDPFDSSRARIEIIDNRASSIEHPQGALVIGVVNAAAFAPHLDQPLAFAYAMAAAPSLIRAMRALVERSDLGEVDLDPDEQAALDEARRALAFAAGPAGEGLA
jgi:hypothetical protein